MSGGRPWVVWLVAIGIVAVAVLLFFALFERTEQVVDEGFSGEARRNPYFAMSKLLQELDAGFSSSTELSNDYGAPHTLMVFLPPGSLTDEQGAELLGWVAKGGHLVTTPQRALLAAFQLELVELEGEDFAAFLPKLYELEPVPGELVSVEMRGAQRLRLHLTPDYSGGPEDGRVVVRYPWQQGHVTFLADSSFLTNRRLKEHDHAEALWLLLTAVDAPLWIQLLHRVERSSLLALVARHAWMVLVAGGLWILLWIRRRGLRHGPLLAEASLDRRSLLEHLGATGDFFLRHGELGVLAASARRALLRRAARHDAAWTQANERERIERLARVSGVDAHELAAAMKDEPNLAPAELMRRMQLFDRVEKAL